MKKLLISESLSCKSVDYESETTSVSGAEKKGVLIMGEALNRMNTVLGLHSEPRHSSKSAFTFMEELTPNPGVCSGFTISFFEFHPLIYDIMLRSKLHLLNG